MMVKVTCHCGKRVRLHSEDAGKRAKCPRCQGSVSIPDEEFFSSHDGCRVRGGQC